MESTFFFTREIAIKNSLWRKIYLLGDLSIQKTLPEDYRLPGNVLGTRDAKVNETVPLPEGTYIQEKKQSDQPIQ
jgi:hypothetical protein